MREWKRIREEDKQWRKKEKGMSMRESEKKRIREEGKQCREKVKEKSLFMRE